MSSMAISKNFFAVAKGLQVDLYNEFEAKHVEVVVSSKTPDNDAISDVTISSDCEHLALITIVSKQLVIYDLPQLEKHRSYDLPRSASKIRFTVNNEQVLVADKSGDILIYNIKSEDTGTKLLGHLSLLLDVVQTYNSKYIISSDRDEKIRVSCYPNTYNIQTYCLGHKEFVNHIELLPHNQTYLTSTSGDGHIKCWHYVSGELCYSIDTYEDVNESTLKEMFIKSMDTERVEVDSLPIVHYTALKLDETSSLLIATVYSYNKILVYKLTTENDKFLHKLVHKLELESFPAATGSHNLLFYTHHIAENTVNIFNVTQDGNNISLTFHKKIKIFENAPPNCSMKESCHEAIKVLYKRKFDNVQEYQERKRQRLEKSNLPNKLI